MGRTGEARAEQREVALVPRAYANTHAYTHTRGDKRKCKSKSVLENVWVCVVVQVLSE